MTKKSTEVAGLNSGLMGMLAIQKEAQSIELRKAIIEKSLAGLVWMCILGIGSVFLSWATAHGFKP